MVSFRCAYEEKSIFVYFLVKVYEEKYQQLHVSYFLMILFISLEINMKSQNCNEIIKEYRCFVR